MDSSDQVTKLLIREGSQPDQFLASCDDDEFHHLRGLLLLLSSNYELDGETIITEEMPPLVFRLYQDEAYLIRFYLEDRDLLRVMRIWRRGEF